MEPSLRRSASRYSIALVALGLLAGCDGERSAANPVNVVLIDVDTLRPDFLGTYGGSRSSTPHIDALAADGIVFENAVSPSPITGPSHAALFTSRHPSELGLVNNGTSRLPEEVPVMAEILDQAGFDTGGVIAIAPIRKQWGFDRGFGTFDDRLRNTWILNAGEVMPQTLEVLDRLAPPFFLWSHLADPHEPYNAHGAVEHEAEVLIGGETIGRVSTSTSNVQLIDFRLRAGVNELVIRGEQPFKIRRLSMRRRGWIKPELDPEHPPLEYFTHYRATITSWRPRELRLVIQLSDLISDPEAILDRYAREVAHVDRHVGLLIDRLKSRGLYDDSLILFTADHGEGLGCHGHGGHVETLYDCMVRVPLIVKPPRASGLIVGQRRNDLAGLIDVLPTVLGILDVEPRPEMRGRDLLDPATVSDPAILMETHRPQAQKTLFGLRGQSHSIIFDATSDAWEFYDLAQDPDQLVNRFDPQDPLIAAWAGRLRQRLRSEAQPLPGVEVSSELDDETREMLRSLGYL